MVYPWKVVGFVKWVNEKGEERVRLYVERQLSMNENESGKGLEAGRLYFNPQYCKYEPVIGHLIIAQEGRYGIQQIVVVGAA